MRGEKGENNNREEKRRKQIDPSLGDKKNKYRLGGCWDKLTIGHRAEPKLFLLPQTPSPMHSVLDTEEDASKLKFGKAGTVFFSPENSKEDSPYLTNEELYAILMKDPSGNNE